jgi:hypothetical protein
MSAGSFKEIPMTSFAGFADFNEHYESLTTAENFAAFVGELERAQLSVHGTHQRRYARPGSRTALHPANGGRSLRTDG